MASFSFGASSAGFQAPQANTGFQFGGQQPTTNFGFGSQQPQQQQQPTNTGFGFGFGTQQPQQQQPQQTGFGFGFGTQQPQQQQQTGFGFGMQQNTLQQQQATAQQQAQLQAQFQHAYANSIEARVTAIKNAYTPSHADCRFQTVFYNKVEPNTIPQYVRPPIANPRLWEAAVKNNPDPSALVPSLAVGFDDLRKRISEQDKAAAAFNATLASMSASLESMIHGHEASTAAALVQLQRVHAQQSHRLLQLVNRVECARSKDVLPRLPTELEYEHKLQVLERKITQPQPLALKIAELAAMVKLAEQSKDANGPAASSASTLSDGSANWLHPDDPSTQQLFTFLQTQRVALEHVTAMVKEDQRDLQTIQQVIQQTNTVL